MEFSFGVRTRDLEEARLWVAQATGLIEVARESSDKGGDYYSFDGPGHDDLWLLRNRDVYDDEPVIDGADAWEVAILVQGASEHSRVVQALMNNPAHFVFAKKW